MSLPWFRTYTRLIDDEKLKLLAFEDRWHFMALLCCKGQGILDNPGDLMRRKVAVKLGLAVRELDEVARRLSEVGLIDAETLQPVSWDKLQFVSDSDPTRNERQARYRENAKRTGNALRNGHVARTDTETETDPYSDPKIQKSIYPEEDSEKEGKRKELAPRKNASRPAPKSKATAVALEGDLIGKDKSTGSRAWDAYAMAYMERYGVEPVRNARTNAQLAQLAKRLPEDEICEVVCWYVRSSNAFYVRDSHGLGLLLRDCEGLRTQWATNSRMTSTEARQMDEHESTYESVRWVRENMDRLRKLRAEGKI